MSPRPVPPKPASSQAGPDLDSTAELPVLDPAAADTPAANTPNVRVAADAPDDPQATTDTWGLTPAARAAAGAAAASAEERRRQESELQSRTAALQEAHERLASHGKRLLQLERARDEALTAQAAAAQRIIKALAPARPEQGI